MKNKFRAFGVSLALFSLFLVALEVIVARTHLFGARKSWSQPDPLIGWRYTPKRPYWHFLENDHAISGVINEWGWRDRKRSLDKPPGTYRIAVIGDSFVEAMQVERDSTFVALVENKFKHATNVPIELLNFGRSGMTQSEEFLVLKNDVIQFSPDHVILLFLPVNDISEAGAKTTDTPLRPFYRPSGDGELILDTSFTESRGFKIRRLINSFKQRSALVSLLAERLNALSADRRVGTLSPENPDRISGALSLCTGNPDPVYQANYAVCKMLIDDMSRFCRERGIAFTLVCSNWVYKPDAIEKYRETDRSFDADFFAEDLRGFAERSRIDYRSLQEPFAEVYAANGHPLHWAHWNYAGHRLAADVLFNHLIASVPPR